MAISSTVPAPPLTQPATASRWQLIWSARLWILGAAIAAAVLALIVAAIIPARYSASALVRVTLPTSAGLSEASVQAADDLASQDTQVATSRPIIARASAVLGQAGAGLTGAVSAATVSSQNLIKISARGDSAHESEQRANAVAGALTAYLNAEEAKNSSAGASLTSKRVGELEGRIEASETAIDSLLARREAGKALTPVERVHLQNLQSEVVSLQGLQQSLLVSSAGQGVPSLTVFAPAGQATKTQPKPAIYALVSFIVVLLIAAEIAVLAGTRKRLHLADGVDTGASDSRA
jgi:capsular polysaccharide biosynthesis protein